MCAKEHDGICLSKQYSKTIEILLWQCVKNHEWKASFHEIKKGSWCPTCARDNLRKYSISDCQKLASKYFGSCLSQEYKNTKTKLLWMCELGHKWTATLGNIKDNGSWCPECSQSYGERKFREIIESLTGHKFPKVRPIWLLNKSGNRMEIDGFCSKLKIGFEYQGRQHLEFIPYWHKRKARYEKQKRSDLLKKSLLENFNIKMLYPTCEIKPSEFKQFIIDDLPSPLSMF